VNTRVKHPKKNFIVLWRKYVMHFPIRHKDTNGDFNAKVGKESYFYAACGGHSLHDEINYNRK